MLHSLLDIESLAQLEGYPRVGGSWEGFGIHHVVERLGARTNQCFYWTTHAVAEFDLLSVAGQHRRGYEFKLGSPGTTASMHIALKDLRLDLLDVIHSGHDSYPLADRIRAVAATRILEDIAPL